MFSMMIMALMTSACLATPSKEISGWSGTSSEIKRNLHTPSAALSDFDKELARLQAETEDIKHSLIETGAAQIDAANGVSLNIIHAQDGPQTDQEALDEKYSAETAPDPEDDPLYDSENDPTRLRNTIREIDLPGTSCGIRNWVAREDPTTTETMGRPLLEDRYLRCPVMTFAFKKPEKEEPSGNQAPQQPASDTNSNMDQDPNVLSRGLMANGQASQTQ